MVATGSVREHAQSHFRISNESDVIHKFEEGVAKHGPDSLEGGSIIEAGSKEVLPHG